MTDVDYLFTANPKSDPNAKPIYEVRFDIRHRRVVREGAVGGSSGA